MNKSISSLTLPCLRGAIGKWIYYSTIIPFEELARIDTEHKIKEHKALDKWLQRQIKPRIEDIKNYLLKENERFFNTIIVGVYGDVPDWYSLDLSILTEKYKLQISNKVKESLGVLTLTGKEILFTVDGQHRVEAIKKALEADEKRFKDDELSVVFVAHSNDEKGYVKTRKLFATINREARQPNANDLAIIDETYAYNIVARMVYSQYKKFDEKIELTDTANMDRSQHKYFTNLLNLVTVNKVLYKLAKYRDNKYTSPSYEQRVELYKIAEAFYDFITENIHEYVTYFSGVKTLREFRNAEPNKPLNLLFLPIGITLLAHIYVHFLKEGKLNELKNKINKINFDLYNGHFKEIYFNPAKNRINPSNQVIGRKLALYLLGADPGVTKDVFKKQLTKAYNINELSKEFLEFNLPEPV